MNEHLAMRFREQFAAVYTTRYVNNTENALTIALLQMRKWSSMHSYKDNAHLQKTWFEVSLDNASYLLFRHAYVDVDLIRTAFEYSQRTYIHRILLKLQSYKV